MIPAAINEKPDRIKNMAFQLAACVLLILLLCHHKGLKAMNAKLGKKIPSVVQAPRFTNMTGKAPKAAL